jgi:hypothetical protein
MPPLTGLLELDILVPALSRWENSVLLEKPRQGRHKAFAGPYAAPKRGSLHGFRFHPRLSPWARRCRPLRAYLRCAPRAPRQHLPYCRNPPTSSCMLTPPRLSIQEAKSVLPAHALPV